jgi:CBS-domain-containing membrane protein
VVVPENILKKIMLVCAAFAGGFIIILVLALLTELSGIPLLMAPFGASCVLTCAVPESPFAHPKNIICGYTIAALIGFVLLRFVGSSPLSLALGVGFTIAVMMLSKTIHPPAGSLPIIIILGDFDEYFMLFPVFSGALILCMVSFLLNHGVFRRIRKAAASKTCKEDT